MLDISNRTSAMVPDSDFEGLSGNCRFSRQWPGFGRRGATERASVLGPRMNLRKRSNQRPKIKNCGTTATSGPCIKVDCIPEMLVFLS